MRPGSVLYFSFLFFSFLSHEQKVPPCVNLKLGNYQVMLQTQQKKAQIDHKIRITSYESGYSYKASEMECNRGDNKSLKFAATRHTQIDEDEADWYFISQPETLTRGKEEVFARPISEAVITPHQKNLKLCIFPATCNQQLHVSPGREVLCGQCPRRPCLSKLTACSQSMIKIRSYWARFAVTIKCEYYRLSLPWSIHMHKE